MSDWTPPGSPPPPLGPPPPPPPPTYGSPPSALWTHVGAPAPSALPWWRTTPAIVGGALVCLVVGGFVGVIVGLVGGEAMRSADGGGVTAADVSTYGGGESDLAVFALGPGQCATDHVDDVSALQEADAVDCSTEHATEVFGHVDAPDIGRIGSGVDRDELADFGDHACYVAFASYVGTTYEDSEYDYRAVIPSEEAWDGGGRTIHCVLFPYETSTTNGTAYGSRR